MKIMIYVLVRAGEGDTEDIIVASSKNEMIGKIEEKFQVVYKNTFGNIAKKSCSQEFDALKNMVENHSEWEPGEYIIKCIDPVFQEVSLYIEQLEV